MHILEKEKLKKYKLRIILWKNLKKTSPKKAKERNDRRAEIKEIKCQPVPERMNKDKSCTWKG